MWAQGLTIGIIIAAGILTHSQRAKKYEEEDEHRVRHLVSGLPSSLWMGVVLTVVHFNVVGGAAR